MAEELGLEQALGDRAAVHGDERLLATRAGAVDGACQQLLTGAALAEDADARVRGGNAARLRQQIFHRRGAGDDLGPPALALARRRRGKARRFGDGVEQHLGLEGLGQERKDAAARGRNGLGNRAVCGEDHDRQRWRIAMDGVEQRHAIHALHAQVGDHDLRARNGQARERGFAGLDRRDVVARGREPHGDQLQEVLVVIDEKHLRGLTAHFSMSLLLRKPQDSGPGVVTRRRPSHAPNGAAA